MPSISSRRRVKRPTVLVKKQPKLKSYNKNLRNSWYEKFKATKENNNSLARALSKEKQESQFLFSQNLELTSQLQDMGILINSRDEILSGILKNSSEALKLLVQVTNCVTSTIVACQTVVGKSQLINSSINSGRRESMRRSTGKSPARGVVQPMVSGHTITKPIINLSRINIPRIRTSPNLSIIDESINVTPERNVIGDSSFTPRRMQQNQINCITNRRVQRLLPERIRLTSPRMSEENEQLSDNETRRLSNRLSHASRKSRRSSRKSDQSKSSPSINGDLQNTIKSPYVTLQDVSRLLQNSHSINIRTLMESSEIINEQESENLRDRTPINNNNDIIISTTQNDEETDKELSPVSSESLNSSPTYDFDPRKKKKSTTLNSSRTEDPLEGPSWLYNTTQSVNSSRQNNISNVLQSTEISNANNSNFEDFSKSSRWNGRKSSKLNSTNTTNTTNESAVSMKTGWNETYCAYKPNCIENEDNNSDNDEDISNNDNEYDSDKCENLRDIVASRNLKMNQNDTFINQRLMQSSKNVTRHRGHSEIDDDDFTMMFNEESKQPAHNMNFDMNELNLPVLEQPLINPVNIEPEPEITTTIKMITQTYHRMPSLTHENMDTSLMENNTTVLIPNIRDSTITSPPDFNMDNSQDTNDKDSEETSSFSNNLNVRKRRRIVKNFIESSSDSEPSVTPEKIPPIKRKNIRKKDPSAAKVVIEKLKESKCKKLSTNSQFSGNNLSLNSMQSDAHSDSEGSNASSMMSSGRPRRQKAPINLTEPKLRTKLRQP